MYRSLAATLCLAAYLSGCTGWHEVAMGSPPPISDHAQSLRLTLTDGRPIELRNARIVGDSVIGGSPARTSVAVHDIKTLAERRANGGKTMLAVIGTLGALAAVGLLVGGGHKTSSDTTCFVFCN